LDLDIALRLTPPLAELTLRGELDLSNADRVTSAVDEAVALSCSLITVDLQDVTFIDCSAMWALVEARHRLNDIESDLSVIGLSPQVSRIMNLTGTDSLFRAVDLVLH